MFNELKCAIFGHNYSTKRKVKIEKEGYYEEVDVCECSVCLNKTLKAEHGFFPIWWPKPKFTYWPSVKTDPLQDAWMEVDDTDVKSG